MLSTFMDEMQITPEQFEIACLAGRQGNGPTSGLAFTQALFQQVCLFCLILNLIFFQN